MLLNLVDLAYRRHYPEVVKIVLNEAKSLVNLAAENPEEFIREAWRAYIEALLQESPRIFRSLPIEKLASMRIDARLFIILARIFHAAYLVSGLWEARYASILSYAASLANTLGLSDLVEVTLLTPASYAAFKLGDREWSLALLGWPLRSAFSIKPKADPGPPTVTPEPWSSLMMANYLRDIAIPTNQEVLYKWGLHKTLEKPEIGRALS